MIYKNKLLVKILIIFFLSSSFLTILHDQNYPDNKNLLDRLYSNHQELDYSPQKLLVKVNKFILETKTIFEKDKNQILVQNLISEMSEYNRLSFFIPTFLLILLLITVNQILGFLEKSNSYKSVEKTYLASLVFPSIILCFTAIGSESIFNIISLFIVANLSQERLSVSRIIFLFPIMFYAYLLDKGNFFILLSFFVGFYALLFLSNYISKIYLFIILSLISLFTTFIGSDFFYYIGSLINSDKMTGLIFEVEQLNLHSISILELAKRYIYFWLTLSNIYFSNHTFSPISLIIIIFCTIVILVEIYKDPEKKSIIKNFYSKNKNFIILLWLVFFPFFVISILPTHAYYKYYIFYIVFIINMLNLVYKKFKIFFIFLCVTILYLIETLLKSFI